ncbi:unnamed protein product [Acanthoscelides obtectus]|uniref:Uncharacterized protein n=1 Tax=Acanthoscelides obtectus TaxID=200917 RepID=A0A9P0KDP8_ACAOB|nr:unnamed protein product [Acanthoscelides obtectus]CAK1640018.1 hypothetical protein AOBTE_LOCUS11510 [Acanthoscelides obtectus]
MANRTKNYPNTVNLETIACEKYMARLLNKEKFLTSAMLPSKTAKEKTVKQLPPNTNISQLTKYKQTVRQQNMPSPKHNLRPDTLTGFADDSIVEVTVKTTNPPRQRSRSTTVEKEPWSQLLKQQRSGDKISLFGNFDPLRTLHFLAKELQYQLQSALPEDSTLQQMVADMQHALKRIPPEVASTVHLQQAIEMFPLRKSSSSENNLKKFDTATVGTQTLPNTEKEDNLRLQKIMEESTIKLEDSCKQMEKLCTKLKEEKDSLERSLAEERRIVQGLEKKVWDLEVQKKEILEPKIMILEEEKSKLERSLDDLAKKAETLISVREKEEFKNQLTEARNSNFCLEQELCKVKHQLRLNTIEKEKYIAILSVRDKQINEIRNEMTQLQEVVNQQLMELHNNAFHSIPNSDNAASCPPDANADKKPVNGIGDSTISTIYSNDEQQQHYSSKSNHSFRDLPSGDIDLSVVLQDLPDSGSLKLDAFKDDCYRI